MPENIDMKKMETRISEIFKQRPEDAESSINEFLMQELASLEMDKKIHLLEKLTGRFAPPDTSPPVQHPIVSNARYALDRTARLLLGRNMDPEDPDSLRLLEELSQAANGVFDAINHLSSTINTTLAGKQGPDETFRQVIGYLLEGSEKAQRLEAYIHEIEAIFTGAHEASKMAAQTMVDQIRAELSPDKIEQDADVTAFTPMRKARCYDAYRLKFEGFEKWFESGRFMESFLKEIEKNCQNQCQCK